MDRTLADRKNDIRKTAHAARKAAKSQHADWQLANRQITDRLLALPEYQSAALVMWYIDVRDEVETRHALPESLASGKGVVVPYCVDDELDLFHLDSMEELETGKFGILEPKTSLRKIATKKPSVDEIDLIVVPGVAFGMDGGRIGHGKGYYDKLLSKVKSETALIGLAMQCQMFDEVPMQAHDIYMDKVVTEERVYRGKRCQ